MIVWLASYPRSGNTYLRIALNRLYGATSSVIYDADGVAQRLGAGLVGYHADSAGYDTMRASSEPHFIKTHRQRDERIDRNDRAICLVRDGRDALVSWARMLSEDDPAGFEQQLAALIEQQDSRGTGGWGANVLSWLQPGRPGCVVIRYETLVQAPAHVVHQSMVEVAPSLSPRAGASIPSFEELAKTDSGFFRRGRSGAWRDEMPAHFHDLFWSRPENRAAMELLGYVR